MSKSILILFYLMMCKLWSAIWNKGPCNSLYKLNHDLDKRQNNWHDAKMLSFNSLTNAKAHVYLDKNTRGHGYNCVVVVFFVFLFVFFSMITFVIAGFYAFPCAELSVILHTDDFGCLLLHADVRGRLCLGGRCYFKHLQVLTSLIEIISTNYPPYQIINI